MLNVAELGTDDEDAMTMDTDATFTQEIKTSNDDDESVKSRDKKPDHVSYFPPKKVQEGNTTHDNFVKISLL